MNSAMLESSYAFREMIYKYNKKKWPQYRALGHLSYYFYNLTDKYEILHIDKIPESVN